MKTGLCSVTFRGKLVGEIIELTQRSKLAAIEWGGDVHVPPVTPLSRLEEIRRQTEDAGLLVSSYGSYYTVLEAQTGHAPSFDEVMDVAESLDTNTIRIWSGGGDSKDADVSTFQQAADRAIELADAAAERKLTLAFEYHRGGLTDTVESTLRLLDLINKPNVKCYYQTDQAPDSARAVSEITRLLPHLLNVHCFYYRQGERLLLEEGVSFWQSLVETLKASGFTGHLLLEFVKDDAEGNFLRDAATLRDILSL